MTGTPSIFTLVGWLVQATAKGSVAILLVAVTQQLIGHRVRARWRHALWLVILLRLVVPIAPSSTWSIFNLVPPHPGIQWQLRGDPGQIVFDGPTLSGVDALPSIHVPWWIASWRWVAVLWLCGVVALSLHALIATVRMHHVVSRARRRNAGSLSLARQIVEEGRRQLGIARPVRVVESALVNVPALHGMFQPTLLLPQGLSETFAADELRHVIIHELWHLRRHDIAVNWILTAVRALYWFNPLVWFAVSRIEEERELACDELALSCFEDTERFDYGRTILKLLERFRAAGRVPALVGIVNQKQKMKRRLLMIGNARGSTPLATPLLVALTAICLVALTDARGGQSGVAGTVAGTLDPAALQTLDCLDQRITLDLTNGSFSDLLAAVASRSGLAVTQSATIAGSPVQHARFTLHAENVPARAVLMKALLPFGLVSEPAATGVKITSAPSCLRRHTSNSNSTGNESSTETGLASKLSLEVTGAPVK